ncbi:hypothetical protein MUP77_09410 [Candidatus Bathyarchaeota archaeon]|nr:hypothetical protein [Candidatus Bathyarchaeota archaeon]
MQRKISLPAEAFTAVNQIRISLAIPAELDDSDIVTMALRRMLKQQADRPTLRARIFNGKVEMKNHV